MSATHDLKIFAAFNCVWCYFNTSQIELLKKEYEVNIVWHAFPLHPDIPPEGLAIAEVFGNNLDIMNEKMAVLQQRAKELGLPLKKRTAISDSRLAQELEKWAETQYKGDLFHNAMNKAYYAEGLNIAKTSVLLDVVESVGLSRREAEVVLEKREFKSAVDNDWQLSDTLNIMAAPSYMINHDRLTGPQSYPTLQVFLESHGITKKKKTIEYSTPS